MAKSCFLLPMLLGAGVFPLSAYALTTVELTPSDGARMLVSEAPVQPHGVEVRMRSHRQDVVERVFAAPPQSARTLPLAMRRADPGIADGVPTEDVSSLLEEVRLSSAPAVPSSRAPASQLIAALAIVALVARRRLRGR